MAHLALYRKYRSQTFSDLVGQDHVVRTLKNGVAQGRFSHAYLFTGPRGTGKTSTARLLAKALNCESGSDGEPCGVCEICTSIAEGSAMDVVEIDAASESGVDDVRESIVQAVEYKPAVCRFRIFIIDEVHDLSNKAFDALLKTIEEPPSHIVFVLATTEFSKVPPTIRSRCQRFEFHRGSLSDLISRLEFVATSEGAEFEPAAIAAIARMADGGYRDALTLLEQAILTSEGPVTLSHVYSQLGLLSDEMADGLLQSMQAGDAGKIMLLTEQVYQTGRDPRSILEALLHRISSLTRAKFGMEEEGSDTSRDALLNEAASRYETESLLVMRSGLAEAHRSIRDISLPRVWMESELIRISRLLHAPAPAAVQAAPVKAQARPLQEAGSPAPAAEISKPVPPRQPQGERTAVQSTTPTPPPSASHAGGRQEASAPPVVNPPLSASSTLSDAGQAWQMLCSHIGAISRKAQNRLETTRVLSLDNMVATVVFDRVSDYDMFNDGKKMKASVMDMWSVMTGGKVSLLFAAAGSGLKMAPVAEVTTVESPLEGEALMQALRQHFEPEQQ